MGAALRNIIVDTYENSCSGLSYALYFDGRPLLYKRKQLRVKSQVQGGRSIVRFFTLAKSTNNRTPLEPTFLTDAEVTEALEKYQVNRVFFGDTTYTFQGFFKKYGMENDFSTTVKATPKIMWINSPIYKLLAQYLKQGGLVALFNNTDFKDDERSLESRDREQIRKFIDTVKSQFYMNYLEFINTPTFSRSFRDHRSLSFFKLCNAFSILSIRFVGKDELTFINPVFDDAEVFALLEQATVFNELLLRPESDRITNSGDKRDWMKEVEIGEFKLLVLSDLEISKLLGLKLRFSFTPRLVAPMFMGHYMPTRYYLQNHRFTGNGHVYMLAPTNALARREYLELGYSNVVSEKDYNKLEMHEKELYRKMSLCQRFLISEYGAFRSLGMNDLQKALQSCEVNVR